MWHTEVDEVLGDDKKGVTAVRVKHNQTGARKEIEAAGLFLAIGHTPNVGFLDGQVELTAKGYIKWTTLGRTYTSVEGVFAGIADILARCSTERFRVTHFSVQRDHLHLIVEADNRAALESGLRSLSIRLALRINRVLGRHGTVWADRHHRHTLKTPREVRNALVYVLMNVKKHEPDRFVFADKSTSVSWRNCAACSGGTGLM